MEFGFTWNVCTWWNFHLAQSNGTVLAIERSITRVRIPMDLLAEVSNEHERDGVFLGSYADSCSMKTMIPTGFAEQVAC